ncbi:MAG: 3-deoxy-D-manno-octulosonic acid transferase [Rickettsiaceae bacterium]|nr:3-deoxy-D-manno-octulosonic acid transferase [Rickettsiaceae bacterium]MDP4833048.1 3-deoxy-D-manno-octulosonic acid transferase [Rickettsiaceae bacterium]MDP5021000.1 3-deoxy-D-manno-octulosonic acid transferase [Rickettsiaceae bacterium]MDP5082669.1 3-deoxy-D-manno-octulosonic acid transferase [Rickettsiaceae bacterium]
MNFILFPVYFVVLLVRLIKKKDNIKSITQRLGGDMTARPSGRLIWMHAASVGEAMVAITLVRELNKQYPNSNYLITTGTLSSADILAKWLPNNAMHQFTPIDNLLVVQKFINHWKPDLGIFIESELWPCLIQVAASRFNLILVNARLSDKSYERWQRRREIFQQIVGNFKNILVQSKSDLDKYRDLGCNKILNLGNLKFANKELEVDKKQLQELQMLLAKKKIFVASSTHHEDEEVTLSIIKNFKQKNINYYPIIVLRHPERRDELAKRCVKLGLSYSIRSEEAMPSLEKDLYIVDSFGELGLFYSLAFMSFVGGSFKHGGHNLMEPAYFDNVIVLGPDMSNFQNIADDMFSSKAALQINNAQELAEKIEFFFDKKHQQEANEFSKNARNFVLNRDETLGCYMQEIGKFLK